MSSLTPLNPEETEMNILIASDLHANWPALEAVLATESFGGGEIVP